VACWSPKAAISLKRVKLEEKLLWRAYRNSRTLFRKVPFPTPYGLFFPKIGGLQPPPKNPIAIISVFSGRGEATDFKFGRNIHRVYPNKSPLKTLETRERGCIYGLPKFSGYPQLSQEWVKLRISNLAGTFTGSIRTKAH